MKEFEQKLLPVENHNVGQVMDPFMEEIHHTPGQQIMNHDIAFEREYIRVVKIAGELNEEWKSHLYLKKMNIKSHLRS